MMKYKVEGGKDKDGSHITSTGGMNPRRITSIEVVNTRLGEGQDRELDYLFEVGGAYTLRGTVTGRMAFGPDTGIQPDIGDFETFFTGVVNTNPGRDLGKNTVTWFMESRLQGETKGPLLTERFNGMARFYEMAFKELSIAPPVFILGDFTVQMYVSFSDDDGSIFRVEDSGTVMFEIFFDDATNTLRIGVDDRTDVYTIAVVNIVTLTDFLFVTVAWDKTGGVFNAWIDSVKELDDEPIVTDILGTASDLTLSDTSYSRIRFSTVRVWDYVRTQPEVLRTLGVIDLSDETDMLIDWEFDEGRGDTIVDHSGNSNHIVIPASTGEWKSIDHGEAFQEGEIKPLALGDIFSAPVKEIDTRLDKGMVSLVLHSINRVYSQGMPLVFETLPISAQFTFNHLSKTVKYSSALATPVFGDTYIINQQVEIVASTNFDGIITLVLSTPNPERGLRPAGLDYLFELQFVDPGWTVSGTEAAIFTTIVGQANWETTTGPFDIPNLIQFNSDPIGPLFANVIGDPAILATSPPSPGFVPPGDISNLLAQMMKLYGPKWNDTIFPLPVYGNIDFRVGYYVDTLETTEKAVNKVSEGCLVWTTESGEGTIGLQQFKFPEDLSGAEVIHESEVIKVEQPHFKDHGLNRLTSLDVRHSKSWVTMEDSSIPAAVDPDTRAFITKQWRTIAVGEVNQIDVITPTFNTYVNSRLPAGNIGEDVLRLSQGTVHFITFRLDAMSQLSSFQQGTLVNADLPKYNLPNLVGVSFGPILFPTIGQITVAVWSEQ